MTNPERKYGVVLIEGVVNIGPALARDLRRAGIATVDQLERLGDREAWRLMRESGSKLDCAHARLAIAGAVAGVRWHDLPPEQKKKIATEAKLERGSARVGRASRSRPRSR